MTRQLAIKTQEAADAVVAAAVMLVPALEEIVSGDTEGTSHKGSSCLCCA